MIVFQHIPKCAGTSIREALLPNFSHSFAIAWDAREESLEELFALDEPPEFVFGHLDFEMIDRIKEQFPNCFTFTFIRHPIERLISHYRFNCSLHEWPEWKDFRKDYPTFESWALEHEPNFLASWMAGQVDSVKDFIEQANDRFDFIGKVETITNDLQRLAAERELRVRKPARLNATNYWEPLIKRQTIYELIKRHFTDIAFHHQISTISQWYKL